MVIPGMFDQMFGLHYAAFVQIPVYCRLCTGETLALCSSFSSL